MNPKNQLIELIYDEDLVLQAELLYEQQSVLDLSHVGSNLHICKVKDGINYEVEIQSPFTKKQKSSCDCSFYKQNRICKHIIAVLFKLRHQANEKYKEKDTKQDLKNSSKHSTLNINQILKLIAPADAYAFVKSYARQDKKFSTLLKVSFARKIDLSDNADKYKNILNTIVKPYTGTQNKSGVSEIRAIANVLQDFLDQINDCIALGQYREAYHIFISAFAKLEYVRHYTTHHTDILRTLSSNYHGLITDFLKEKLPAELRSDLHEFLFDLAKRSYYHFNDINKNILNMMYAVKKNIPVALIGGVVEELVGSKDKDEKIVLLALQIKFKGKFTKADAEELKPFTLHFIEIADLLLSNNEEELALKILEHQYSQKRFIKDVANRLVFLYVRFKNVPKLKQTSIHAYMNTGDLKYIDILKKELSEEEFMIHLLQLGEHLKMSKVDPSLLIKLYKKEEDWIGLLEYMQELRDLDLLKQYDVLLYKHQRSGLVELYLSIIDSYLTDHIGDIALGYIEDLKYHIKTKKMDGIIRPIHDMLKEKYPYRPMILDAFN